MVWAFVLSGLVFVEGADVEPEGVEEGVLVIEVLNGGVAWWCLDFSFYFK